MSDTHAYKRDGDSSRATSVNEVGTETSLSEMIIVTGEHKYFILCVTALATALGVAISFLLPPVYVGQTVIMPPQQSRSEIAALTNLGDLAGLGDAIGGKTSDQMYVGLLQSDAIASDLIAQFKLQERYRVKFASDARLALHNKVHVTSDKKNGFITIAASDRSPMFAAKLANAYVDELRKILDRLAVTDAQQRRVFFEQQIEKTLSRLSEAQIAFDRAQKKSGVVSLDEQVASTIRASADLKARIAALEVKLQSMRTYATDQNPEMLRAAAEVREMRDQLDSLEQGDKDAMGVKPSNDSTALANIRAYREVKYQEALLDQFRKQLELAQVDEAKEGPLVQQIDIASPPDRRSAPKRTIIVMISAIIGLLMSTCIAQIRTRLRSNDRLASQLVRIKEAWRPMGPKAR